MSDDSWKRGSDDDFGAPLFGDDSVEGLTFGDGESEPMPHWTAPPTGEVPATLASAGGDDDAEVDVWSSFAGQAPSWSDSDGGRSLDDLDDLAPAFDDGGTPSSGLFDEVPPRRPAGGSGSASRFDEFGDDFSDPTGYESGGGRDHVDRDDIDRHGIDRDDIDRDDSERGRRPAAMPLGSWRGSRPAEAVADRGRRGSRIQIG
ncbi:MAG: hypothetical protein ACKOAZ_01545, partial [Ilumatobacteraceae bacterium]